jgi:hypothetical protein
MHYLYQNSQSRYIYHIKKRVLFYVFKDALKIIIIFSCWSNYGMKWKNDWPVVHIKH